MIVPIHLAYCKREADGLRQIPLEFITKRQLPPIDVQVMAIVKEDRLNKYVIPVLVTAVQ